METVDATTAAEVLKMDVLNSSIFVYVCANVSNEHRHAGWYAHGWVIEPVMGHARDSRVQSLKTAVALQRQIQLGGPCLQLLIYYHRDT